MLVNHGIPVEQELDDIEAGFAPLRKKRAGLKPEQRVQRLVINAVRRLGIVAVHVPNGGKRGRWGHTTAKLDGEVAGFPDVLLYGRDGRHALFEVKPPEWKAPRAPKIGQKPSASFKDWAERIRLYEDLRGRHFEVEVVRSLDQALGYLRAWGWIGPAK